MIYRIELIINGNEYKSFDYTSMRMADASHKLMVEIAERMRSIDSHHFDCIVALESRIEELEEKEDEGGAQ